MDQVSSKPPSWLVIQFRYVLNSVQFRKALRDIGQGCWQRWELWGTMGFHDIRQRYRRSLLGPFWITISMGIMIGTLGLLYSTIFKVETQEYMPYLTAGFLVWGLLSTLILDGTNVFIASEGLIRQLAAPLSIHVYKVLWTNLIILAHNIWIFVFVALWYQLNPGWTVLLAAPALLLFLINGLWIGLLLGMLSARFRDIPLIVTTILQVAFFITPVFWKPDMLTGRMMLLHANPFYYFVEIMRAPLLGNVPQAEHWISVLVITVLGWGITLLFFTAYRWRLAYWV